MKFHPDQNGGDVFFEDMFKLINEAYTILGDAASRKTYDERLRGSAGPSASSSQNSSDEVRRKEEELRRKEEEIRRKEYDFYQQQQNQEYWAQHEYEAPVQARKSFAVANVVVLLVIAGSLYYLYTLYGDKLFGSEKKNTEQVDPDSYQQNQKKKVQPKKNQYYNKWNKPKQYYKPKPAAPQNQPAPAPVDNPAPPPSAPEQTTPPPTGGGF